MKRLALLAITTGLLAMQSLQAAEVVAEREENAVGTGFGGLTGLMVGAAAGGPVGALVGVAVGGWSGAKVQRASGHYMNRLDQPTSRYDPTRTALSGAQIVGNVADGADNCVGLAIQLLEEASGAVACSVKILAGG